LKVTRHRLGVVSLALACVFAGGSTYARRHPKQAWLGSGAVVSPDGTKGGPQPVKFVFKQDGSQITGRFKCLGRNRCPTICEKAAVYATLSGDPLTGGTITASGPCQGPAGRVGVTFALRLRYENPSLMTGRYDTILGPDATFQNDITLNRRR